MKILRETVACFVLLTVLCGMIYPLAITGVGKVVFPRQAEGSLIDKDGKLTGDEGKAVGSLLIGQNFDRAEYFWGRPSATMSLDAVPQAMPYNAANSSGSNTGPSGMADVVKGRVAALRAADPGNEAAVPVDLVTASGSGLDPEESVAAAEYQIPRIARVRGVDAGQLRDLVAKYTQGPAMGVLGERVVNVLELNLELDRVAPFVPPATGPATMK